MYHIHIAFDDEDVMTPAEAGMDDVSGRVSEIMTEVGVLGCFNLTGEKARNLQRRGRADVIAAMKQHTIASHTDNGSRHPMFLEAIQSKDWDTAVASTLSDEQMCAASIRETFGKEPTHIHCHAMYADPVSTAVAGILRKPHTIVSNQVSVVMGDPSNGPVAPFREFDGEAECPANVCWWCGAVCFGSFGGVPEWVLAGPAEGLEPFIRKYREMFSGRTSYPVVGYVHLGHPMMFRAKYYTEPSPRFFGTDRYWAINGWNLPQSRFGELGTPELRTKEEINRLYQNFRRFVVALKECTEVRFLASDEALKPFWFQPPGISRKRLEFHADAVQQKKDFIVRDVYSPAEILLGFCQAIVEYDRTGGIPETVKRMDILGPKRAPVYAPETVFLMWEQVVAAASELVLHGSRRGYLLENVVFEGRRIGVGSLMDTFSWMYRELLTGRRPDRVELDREFPRVPREGVEMAKFSLGVEECALFEPEMSIENLYRWTKLQGWTLKRAICGHP